jgi:hypothetical protein
MAFFNYQFLAPPKSSPEERTLELRMLFLLLISIDLQLSNTYYHMKINALAFITCCTKSPPFGDDLGGVLIG